MQNATIFFYFFFFSFTMYPTYIGEPGNLILKYFVSIKSFPHPTFRRFKRHRGVLSGGTQRCGLPYRSEKNENKHFISLDGKRIRNLSYLQPHA